MSKTKKKEFKFILRGIKLSDLSTSSTIGKNQKSNVQILDSSWDSSNAGIRGSEYFEQIGDENRYITFSDIKKREVKLWPLIVNQNNNPIPQTTDKPCRNCHRYYNTKPFGCPMKIVRATSGSDLQSQKEMILKYFESIGIKTTNASYFVSDGQQFCSLPCVKSYIITKLSMGKYKYNNSLSYLTIMLKIMYNIKGKPPIIPSTHPIETRENYLGHLNDKDFESTINLVQYSQSVNIEMPIILPPSSYIEETILLK